MTKTIVVIGATGAQGSSVAKTFLALPGWRVRGVTRNLSGEAAQALEKQGVELVKADLDDKDSLRAAFEGAHVIFSNTDYFIHLFQGMGMESRPNGRSVLEYAFDREVEQGVNTAEAAASPSVLKTLERFVWSSLADATKWSGGKINTVYHFDSKAEVVRQIHQRFPQVAQRLSAVQVGHYLENAKAFPLMAPQRQPDGSYTIVRPIAPSTLVPFIDTRRDTGPVVKAVVDLPAGKEMLAVTQEMTWPEWTKLWGDVMGVKAEYKKISHEEFWKGLPEPLAVELGDAWRFADEYGQNGADTNLLRSDTFEPKIPLSSVAEWIKEQDWSAMQKA